VRQPIRRYFKHEGFFEQEAGSVAEVVAGYQSSRPDLCLLDYSLSDGDGIELLGRLKALDP
jgi:DNA-binding response OmpR family regulator